MAIDKRIPRDELTGIADYVAKVRYRLIPAV
jgi:hypothetical protein